MQNYASLQETHDAEEQGILFHTAEPTRSRWNHIDNLDAFFTNMYKYHQKHGFLCMVLKELFELHQYFFVVLFTTYLIYGVDYSKLLDPKLTKLHFSDVILTPAEVYENLTGFASFVLLIAAVIWVLKFLRKAYYMIMFWDIKQFYNTALKIPDSELDNVTWSEIQNKIKIVQLEQQMCIHKRELTELDIYHRILRQENYMVAMVNKKLLPPRFNLPFCGEIVYWTNGLRYNIQGLLFWTPWSPFENPWHLRENFKKQENRFTLANQLGRQILWVALINLMLAPVIFIWQFLLTFFSYGELIRREPGRLGVRKWSCYGKLFLRHFNELNHELDARLTRAYRPATKYLSAFNSPIVIIIAEHVAFLCGSLFAALLMYTLIDDTTLRIDNFLVVMTILGSALPICRSLIPDESQVWLPEALLQAVALNTHYLPNGWQGQAHTSKIREEFQQLFQYRFVSVLESILSPLLTPFLLWYWVYPRSLEIVDFFRNFTVSVVGVGDVCSFAQMDIRKHGNPLWHAEEPTPAEPVAEQKAAEDGKTELSLIHFTSTNPDWRPPPTAQEYIESIQEEAKMQEGQFFDSDLELMSGLDTRLDLEYRENLNLSNSALFKRGSAVYNKKSLIEGPDPSSLIKMRKSILAAHSLNEQHTRVSRLFEETTPLLSTQN